MANQEQDTFTEQKAIPYRRVILDREEYRHPVTGKKFGEFVVCFDGDGNIRDLNEPRDQYGFLRSLIPRTPVSSIKISCPTNIPLPIYEKALEEVKKHNSYKHPVSNKYFSELEDIVIDSEGNFRERNEFNINMSLSSGKRVTIIDSPDIVEIQNNTRSKETKDAISIARNMILGEKTDFIRTPFLRMEERLDEMGSKCDELLKRFDETLRKGQEALRISDEKENQQFIKESKEETLISEKPLQEVNKSHKIEEETQKPLSINEIFIDKIIEFLKIIQDLLKNLETIPREEEKIEPRKLGFF